MVKKSILFVLLILFPQFLYAQSSTCSGDWEVYLPHMDSGPIQKSDKVSWHAGDYSEYSALEFQKDRVEFIKNRYLSIGYVSPVTTACEKYGPPFYVLETDLPEYIEEEIRKYRCKSRCHREVSTNAVSDIRDVLIYYTDHEGFVADCHYGFMINIYCIEKPARYFDKAFLITPLINF